MKRFMLVALMLPLVMLSCKKKEEKSKTEILQEGKWKLTKLNFSNESGSQDLLDITADCDKDNFYLFNADKSITADEGDSKCESSNPQTRTDGKWALENNDSRISFTGSSIFGASDNISFTVVNITSSTIEFTKDSTIVAPPPVGTLSGKFTGTFTNIK